MREETGEWEIGDRRWKAGALFPAAECFFDGGFYVCGFYVAVDGEHAIVRDGEFLVVRF